jgi:hypothetical protein
LRLEKGRRLLSARLRRHIAEFKRRAGTSQTDGAADRVLTKFALVFAAVRLARYWRILPISLSGKAVLTVYQRHLAQRAYANRTLKTDAIARVREYVQRTRSKLIDFSDDYPKLSDEEFKAAPGFVLRKGGSTWLLVSTPRWSSEFATQGKAMLEELKAQGRLRATEGYQWQTRVRKNKKTDRVHAIRID